MARKLVIFDLDETLVHATVSPLAHGPSFEYAPYFVYRRPFVAELLAAVQPHYDLAVWSSSSRGYVDAVVEAIFGVDYKLQFAWSVERCIQRVHAPSNAYVYIKDLRRVQGQGYCLDRIMMVDDSPEKVARQPRNHVQIKPFLGQTTDRELLALADRLLQMASK